MHEMSTTKEPNNDLDEENITPDMEQENIYIHIQSLLDMHGEQNLKNMLENQLC